MIFRLAIVAVVLCSVGLSAHSELHAQGFGTPNVVGGITGLDPANNSTHELWSITVDAEALATNFDVIDVEFWITTAVYKKVFGEWVHWQSLTPEAMTLAPGDTGSVWHSENYLHSFPEPYKVVSTAYAAHSYLGGEVLGPPLELGQQTNNYYVNGGQ